MRMLLLVMLIGCGGRDISPVAVNDASACVTAGPLSTSDARGVVLGVCTLDGCSPSTCTVAVPDGTTHCLCNVGQFGTPAGCLVSGQQAKCFSGFGYTGEARIVAFR